MIPNPAKERSPQELTEGQPSNVSSSQEIKELYQRQRAVFRGLDQIMFRFSAWRIPGTGEPGRLPSVGSHRVGPRSKRLLISQLQSPSAVTLEPRKIKSDTVSPSIFHEVMGPGAMILVMI